MEKTIILSADLLERVKEITGATDMEESRLVSLCLEAGLATTKKEGTPRIRSTVAEIGRVLDRANLRQLTLILGIAQDIVGKEAMA